MTSKMGHDDVFAVVSAEDNDEAVEDSLSDADLRGLGGKLAVLSVSKIVPHPDTPLVMKPAVFSRLVQDTKETACIRPIAVVDLRDGTYRCIAGEHHWKAAEAAGRALIPAFVLDLDDWDEERQITQLVRSHVLSTEIDPLKLIPLWNRLTSQYGADAARTMLAFDTDDKRFRGLIDKMADGLRQSVSPAASADFERKARKAQTIEDLHAILQEIFNQQGPTLDQGYMVFAYGGQRNLYVPLNQRMRRVLDEVTDYLGYTGQNLQDFMAPVLESMLSQAEAAMAAQALHPTHPKEAEDDALESLLSAEDVLF